MTFHAPARFERTRVWIARNLLMSRPLSRLALAIVPRNHPWKWWFESHVTHIEDVTRSTLQPRARPVPLELVTVQSRASVRYRPPRAAVWATWAVGFLMVGDVVSMLPGPGLVEPDPVTPVAWVGLTDEPIVAPSIPELVRRAVDATTS